MKVLFDTSILVAAMVEGHPRHQTSLPWLQKALTGKIAGYICCHTLAELYAVLTSLPVRPRLTSAVTIKLIKNNILDYFMIVELDKKDYVDAIEKADKKQMTGGVIYDCLIVSAAEKVGAEVLLTLDSRDFRSILRGQEGIVRSP